MTSSAEQQLADMLKAVGLQLKGARVERGWSREDVARASGVPLKTVGDVERGTTRKVEPVWKIAFALELALSDVVRKAEKKIG